MPLMLSVVMLNVVMLNVVMVGVVMPNVIAPEYAFCYLQNKLEEPNLVLTGLFYVILSTSLLYLQVFFTIFSSKALFQVDIG
jgi:hypothetical protein